MSNINLTDLSVEETNVILNALAKEPYAQVAGLITKIHTQGNQQLAEVAPQSGEVLSDSPN